jgi:hypothetical protein
MQRFLPLPKSWWVPTPHVLMGPSPPLSRWDAHMCDEQSGEHRREGEQSSGCSHCPIVPTRADCLMMAALRFLRRAS